MLFLEPQCPGCITPPRYQFDAVSEAGGGRPQGIVGFLTRPHPLRLHVTGRLRAFVNQVPPA